MMEKWKLISSKKAFDNKWFKVRQDTVELSSGKIVDDYFVWDSEDATMIVPVTADGKFVMVKQYKHGAGEIVIEFPAGLVEKNESFENSALRELEEETGYTAGKIIPIGYSFFNPTKATGKIYYFLATGCKLEKELNLDEIEDIEVILVERNELRRMIEAGVIKDSNTIACFFKIEKLFC